MTKTFSNRSNAVRGFKATNETALSNEILRGMVQELAPGRFAVVVPVSVPDSVVTMSPLKGVPMVRRSAREGAVAESHSHFSTYAAKAGEAMTRKGAVAYAVANGIAFYTARTQYQRWSRSFG